MDCIGERYVAIRAAQQHTLDTVPNTGMAVITDLGMQFDIHPKMKQPVGHRLALLAQNKVYGDTVLCEAPTLSKIEVEGERLILTFENAGEGLYLADTAPYGQKIGREKLGGLQIFQDGKKLDDVCLKAQVDGNKVYLYSDDIQSGLKTQVRLAETGWHLVNLYNSADIPARPALIDDKTT